MLHSLVLVVGQRHRFFVLLEERTLGGQILSSVTAASVSLWTSLHCRKQNSPVLTAVTANVNNGAAENSKSNSTDWQNCLNCRLSWIIYCKNFLLWVFYEKNLIKKSNLIDKNKMVIIFCPILTSVFTCIVLRSAHMFWKFHFFWRKYLTLTVNPMNFVLILVFFFYEWKHHNYSSTNTFDDYFTKKFQLVS